MEERDDDKVVNEQQQIKLLLTGDVMTGRGIDQILLLPGAATLHEDYVRDARVYIELAERKNGPIPRQVDNQYIWGEALGVWRACKPDLRIINLETSITTSDDFWPSKGIHYRMHPQNVPCLTAAGVDCCVLANNHILDWGHTGLEETLAILHRSGLSTTGAGRNIAEAARPARLESPDKTVVLVFAFADMSCGVPDSWRATCERGGVNLLENLGPDTARQVAEQMLAQRKHNEIIIASIHWGGNWGYDVPLEQLQFAHSLIDHAAVDVVHGHSSHHAKGIEIYEGKPIIYGCGDFLNDYEGIGGEEQYRPWLAAMYFVTIDVTSRALENLEIVAMQLQRFRVVQATPEDRQWFIETLSRVSKDFGTTFEPTDSGIIVSAISTEHLE
jgi:poly-gamma-glutamate capsule biosynthesis protein CapA/YwtB (metallophosphatase superfamily)